MKCSKITDYPPTSRHRRQTNGGLRPCLQTPVLPLAKAVAPVVSPRQVEVHMRVLEQEPGARIPFPHRRGN